MIKKDYPDDWSELDKKFAKLMKDTVDTDFYEEIHGKPKPVDYDKVLGEKDKGSDDK